MIFILSDDFEDFDWTNSASEIAALESLFTAHANGWHLVSLSAMVSTNLLRSNSLSARGTEILKHLIIEKRSVLAGQALSAPFVAYCTPMQHLDDELDGRLLPVVLSELSDIEICLKSMLLVENAQSDGKFYQNLAELYSKKEFSNIPIRLELMMGGGGTLGGELKRLEELSTRPMITVVDSDRSYPNGAIGSTARKALESKTNERALSIIEVIKVRSIESLIPTNHVRNYLPKGHIDRDRLDAIEKIDANITYTENESLRLWHFISLRKGLKFRDFRKADQNFKVYLTQFFSELEIDLPQCDARSAASDEEILMSAGYTRLINSIITAAENDNSVLETIQTTALYCPIVNSIAAKIACFGIGGARQAAFV